MQVVCAGCGRMAQQRQCVGGKSVGVGWMDRHRPVFWQARSGCWTRAAGIPISDKPSIFRKCSRKTGKSRFRSDEKNPHPFARVRDGILKTPMKLLVHCCCRLHACSRSLCTTFMIFPKRSASALLGLSLAAPQRFCASSCRRRVSQLGAVFCLAWAARRAGGQCRRAPIGRATISPNGCFIS